MKTCMFVISAAFALAGAVFCVFACDADGVLGYCSCAAASGVISGAYAVLGVRS